MESNKIPTNISEIRALIKAKQKYYEEAIKNNVSFDKLKAIHESISELKSLLPKK